MARNEFNIRGIVKPITSVASRIDELANVSVPNLARTISSNTVNTFKRMSNNAIESVTKGVREISSGLSMHFKSGLSKVLSPLETLVGPFSSILKGSFLFFKSFFSRSDRAEKVATDQREKIVDELQEMNRRDEKEGQLKDPKTKKRGLIGRLLGGFLTTMFGGVFSAVSPLFKGPLAVIKKLFSNKIVAGMIKPFTKIGRILGRIGLRFIAPVIGVYRAVTGVMDVFREAETIFDPVVIREALLAGSAGLLSVVLEIPEMLGNGILWLFEQLGFETGGFRFDFGVESIKTAINSVTDWVFNNITTPFLDFLSGDVTGMLSGVVSFIGDFFSGIFSAVDNAFGGVVDMIKTALSKIPFIEKFVDVDDIKTPTLSSKNVNNTSQSVSEDLNKARIDRDAKKAESDRRIEAAIVKGEQSSEDTRMIVQELSNNRNESVTVIPSKSDDIPSEPENFGVLFMTKTWGQG